MLGLRSLVLALGCRNAAPIRIAVRLSKQAEIDVAFVNLGKVHGRRRTFLRRNVLEEKDIEEPAENRVLPYVVSKQFSLSCELALHA